MARILIASLCAALVVAVALLVVPWPSAEPKNAQDVNQGGTEGRLATRHSEPGRPPASKLPRKEPTHKPQEATPATNTTSSHTPEDLKDFFLPEMNLEEATLEEAVRRMLYVYEGVCNLTDQKPLSFSTNIAEPSQIKISADLSGHSFLSALQLISAHAGVTFNRNGTELNFKPPGGRPLEPSEVEKPPARKIKYTTTVLASAQELEFVEGQVLSPRELVAAMRTASQQHLDMQSLPSLILRSGQDAEIQIPGGKNPVMTTKASPYGFGVSADTILEPKPGQENEAEATLEPRTDVIPPGHWLVRTEQSSEGTYRYVLLQPSVADPATAPLESLLSE